jgi:CDP-diacylglycerol--glycerol-3-phosphate 3-phosphatidyltransferase/cardiolipin synthase
MRSTPEAKAYRFADLFLPPGLLSASRIALALCFPFVVNRPVAALAVLTAAAVSDVLDGWVARRYRLATATGAAFDAITDKLFVLTVAITLVASGLLPVQAVLLLSTRELGEAPLVAWLIMSPRARARRADHPAANVPGKVATTLQFVAVALALLRSPGVELMTVVTAMAGAFAALSYWRRELAGRRPSSQAAASSRGRAGQG